MKNLIFLPSLGQKRAFKASILRGLEIEISLPMFCYRIAMLSWALCVAWAFLSWIKWGWKMFTMGNVWKPVRLVRD